jgi:hypothetical protein
VDRGRGVDLVGDVPGNRLALAIRVGGEVDRGPLAAFFRSERVCALPLIVTY